MAKRSGGSSYVRSVIALCGSAVIVLLVTGLLWWHQNMNNPKYVFGKMLSSSLSTPSITRHTNQASQTGTLNQVTRLSLGGQSVASSLTAINQPAETGDNTVVTQTIGTPGSDYARYIKIDTTQRGANSQPLDFSSVLGVWGKSEDATNGQASPAQFLSGTIFGYVPFAPLNHQERQQVLNTIYDKNMFDIDYSKVTSRNENGRHVFVYKASVNTSSYVSMLKVLAKQLGLNQLDRVDPANFASNPAEQLEITVDKLSYQLTKISYASDGHYETYSGHGLQEQVALPSKTIPLTELQQRLQSVQ